MSIESLLARVLGREVTVTIDGRVLPPPEPEWERIAAEITAARAEEPLTFRHCIPCGVTWRGGPACWCCGRAEAAC